MSKKQKLPEWQKTVLEIFSIPFIFGKLIGLVSNKILEYIGSLEE